MEITQKQIDVFNWLKTQSPAPTYSEVAEHFGLSRNAAYARVTALVRRGYVAKAKNQRRGLEVIA